MIFLYAILVYLILSGSFAEHGLSFGLFCIAVGLCLPDERKEHT